MRHRTADARKKLLCVEDVSSHDTPRPATMIWCGGSRPWRTLKGPSQQPGRQGAERAIETWIAVTRVAAWKTPIDVKADFGQTDILPDGRVILDLGGNKYRLVAWINYRKGLVLIKFIGTHEEHDRIDPGTVG